MQERNEISAREAAKRLGVGLGHLYQLLWTGKILAHKQNGEWRISKEAVEARLRAVTADHGTVSGETERKSQ